MLNIYSFIQSFFAVWAISRLCGLSTRHPLTLVLFVIFTFFFRYISAQKKTAQGASCRRIGLVSCLTALFFTLASLLARHEQLTAGLDNALFCFMILSASAVGFFFLFHNLLLFVYLHAISFSLTEMPTVHTYHNPPLRFMVDSFPSLSLPVISFFLCLLGWLPYFLYEYPAIMTPDSINQLEQVLGMIPYSNHHPWAHTMVIKFWYSVGSLFTQNPNTALAFFTVFQMCFMALCVSWLVATLRKLRVGVLLCLLTAAFYAFVPYHGVFAVTIWKDVMFSGSVLLLTTTLVRLLCLSGKSKKRVRFHLLSIFCPAL